MLPPATSTVPGQPMGIEGLDSAMPVISALPVLLTVWVKEMT